MVRHFSKIAGFVALVALAGCAGAAPGNINNVCAVFAQNDGWVENWQRSASKAQRRHGVPVPVIMATMRHESGFRGNARPPRKYYLGFIPGGRASSAYGYSQALDGTWDQYIRETGSYGARRSSFDDAADFIGWYHSQTAKKFGVSPGDAYNLSLAYHAGWDAYRKRRFTAGMQSYAQSAAKRAAEYGQQMRGCD